LPVLTAFATASALAVELLELEELELLELEYSNELELLEYYREMYKEEVMEYPEVATHLNFFLDTQREAVGFYGDIIAMFESEKDNANICMVIDHKLKKLA
jgi:hypothetical protein